MPIVVSVLIACAAAPLRAEDAKTVFDSLFANELRRVASTRETVDDVALAQNMVAAARTSTQSPELVTLLCERAYLLGSGDPAGYDTSIEAMMLLGETVPDKRAACEQKALVVMQRRYDRASRTDREGAARQYVDALVQMAQGSVAQKDYNNAASLYRRALGTARSAKLPEAELQAGLDYVTAVAKTQSQIDLLRSRLAAQPDDQLSNASLAKLYVSEMDDPLEASKYIEHSGDEQLMINVLLATQPPADLKAPEAMVLAQWYEQLGQSATRAGKLITLGRARTYYARFLSDHQEQDLSFTRATVGLKNVQSELDSLQAVAAANPAIAKPAAGDWINLLAKVDPVKDGLRGTWTLTGGNLVVQERTYAYLAVPAQFDGDYELQVQFARTAGDGSIGVLLPVGDRAVQFVMDYRSGRISGFYSINDQGADDNGSAVAGTSLINNKPYMLEIKVASDAQKQLASIVVFLNGRPFTKWAGDPAQLRARFLEGIVGPKQIALSTMGASATFATMRVRMTRGEAVDYRREGGVSREELNRAEAEMVREELRRRFGDGDRDGDRPRGPRGRD